MNKMFNILNKILEIIVKKKILIFIINLLWMMKMTINFIKIKKLKTKINFILKIILK